MVNRPVIGSAPVPGGEPWLSLMNARNGMLVPPWEFYDRVIGHTIQAGDEDHYRLPHLARTVTWSEREGRKVEHGVTLAELADALELSYSAALGEIKQRHADGLVQWQVQGNTGYLVHAAPAV